MVEHDAIAGLRCFFLAAPPETGQARLAEDDEQHALRVLRMGVGERLVGLDGNGGRWPLRVVAVTRKTLELEPIGEAQREPEPGAVGAPLPWIELAVSFPKGARSEEMLDRLVQLGIAAVVPLDAARTQGFVREQVDRKHGRWQRVLREACKQCRRAWLPELGDTATIEALLARPAAANVLLAPGAAARLAEVLARVERGTRANPLRLWVGPEGGWTSEEHAQFVAGQALEASLAPHVLRLETAAEAAAAIAVHALWRR